MARRSRNQSIRLKGVDRVLFIIGAVLYVLGLFGGLGLLAMPATTAILLLVFGGGCLLGILLKLQF